MECLKTEIAISSRLMQILCPVRYGVQLSDYIK